VGWDSELFFILSISTIIMEPANLVYFEIKEYDDKTLRLIANSITFYNAFKDASYSLPYSDSQKVLTGLYAFNKSTGVDFYNSMNLTRIISYLEGYFNGDYDGNKRKVFNHCTFLRSKELRMYQMQLAQVLFIEQEFKNAGVKVKYTIALGNKGKKS